MKVENLKEAARLGNLLERLREKRGYFSTASDYSIQFFKDEKELIRNGFVKTMDQAIQEVERAIEKL